MIKSVLALCRVFAHLYAIFAGVNKQQLIRTLVTIKQVVPSNNSCTRHVSGIMNMKDYYFYLAPNEDYLGWEFTISDLIESEFEAKPDNFPDKSAKIEFLKELIANIGKCIEKVEKEEGIVV